jgi:adenylate cyclase
MDDRNLGPGTDSGNEHADRPDDAWHKVLVDGLVTLRLTHRVFRHLPSAPRCKLCHNPFGGVGGWLVGKAGFTPSRKNPNLCARCCDRLPPGGLELDIAVLFADVRGSTALGERIGAREFAGLLNSFYRIATSVLLRHDAIIDKLVGDEVMALFIPGIAGKNYRHRAADAGIDLISALASQTTLPVGVAVHAGVAYVGNVGADHVVDFTALGDPVNTAAHLQTEAQQGELVLADDIYEEFNERYPDAEHRLVNVHGRGSPVGVRVLRVSPGAR